MKIKANNTYRISGYESAVHPAWRQKLFAMGMLPSTLVDIIRVAPLGDPIQISTRRLSLAVRQGDLASIKLEEVCG